MRSVVLIVGWTCSALIAGCGSADDSENSPLAKARQDLADRHRERTLALGKLRAVAKTNRDYPALAARVKPLARDYLDQYVAAEEQFVRQREELRRLGGKWVLFGPSALDSAGTSDQDRIRRERSAVAHRRDLLAELQPLEKSLQPRIAALVESYDREVKWWDQQLQTADVSP